MSVKEVITVYTHVLPMLVDLIVRLCPLAFESVSPGVPGLDGAFLGIMNFDMGDDSFAEAENGPYPPLLEGIRCSSPSLHAYRFIALCLVPICFFGSKQVESILLTACFSLSSGILNCNQAVWVESRMIPQFPTTSDHCSSLLIKIVKPKNPAAS